MSVRSRAACVGAVAERVEVVVDGLDLGALDDGEAQTDEDVLELAPGLGDQVQPPDAAAAGAGEGDVDAVGGQSHVELARRPARWVWAAR